MSSAAKSIDLNQNAAKWIWVGLGWSWSWVICCLRLTHTPGEAGRGAP